ncbi:hypothetical protein L7F22_035885 [Adiantum nelumboides]|nr:hypothetical protein [Adiantum nelumboides]
MSQESQGESPSNSILTSCTISQCIVDQIPSIFDGELRNFNVLKDDDDDIDLFVECHEMAQEISTYSSKVNECFDDICDKTLKRNDDDLSFLVEEEEDIINLLVNSLTLDEDVCIAHDVVLDDEIFKQQNVACVKYSNLQTNAMLNEYSLEAKLCDGICLSIHTISAYLNHDGALMLIHDKRGDDYVFVSKVMLLFVHDDAKLIWLFLIVSLEGIDVVHISFIVLMISLKDEDFLVVYAHTMIMGLMFDHKEGLNHDEMFLLMFSQNNVKVSHAKFEGVEP